MAHTHPAPTIVADGVVDSASGTSLTVDIPTSGFVVDDQMHLILLLHQATATSSNPTTTASGWTRRDRHNSSGGAGILVLDYYTHTVSGSEGSTVTFTTSVTADALSVAFVIDSHSGFGSPFFSPPQFIQFGNPNATTLDPRYFQGGTLAPHDAVRFLSVVILAGADDGGSVGSPSAGPTGYDMRGISAGDEHLWVATKRTGFDQEEDPGYPTLGVGGSVFQTPGGGWTWSGFGTPENDDGAAGAASGTAIFQRVDMMETWHYHEFVPEEEEDFPYWGLLGAMS